MVTVRPIVRPHRIKGHVIVAPETDYPAERFAVGAIVHWLKGGDPDPVEIVTSGEHQGRWIVGFAGVTTMNDAETLRGRELRIPAEALRPLAPGGFYTHDLAGCEVELVNGQRLGRVERVDFGHGTPLLAVRTDQGEVLIPLAETVCRRIDIGAKLIVIDPPEGLIELND